jgi:predicted DNA-binding protein (MmcQ/YjbR family)
MTKDGIIDYCLSLDGAFKRYPFGDQPLVLSIPPKKGLCDIYESANPLHIIVKCDPMEAEFLRSVYHCVKPGYHCNKVHWNSIFIDGTLSDEEIYQMILNSYHLANGKSKRKS